MYYLIKIYILFPFIKLSIEKDKKNLKYILIFLFIFSFFIEFLNTLSILSNKIWNYKIINFNDIRSNYFYFDIGVNYLFYFFLGYALHERYYNRKLPRYSYAILSLTFILGLCMMLFDRYLQVGSFVSGKYVRINNDYSKIGNLCMSVSFFILCSQINFKENKIISFIGKRTNNIYYIHMLIVSFAYKYLLPQIRRYGAFVNFLRTIVVIIICIGITELLKLFKPIKKILNLS